MKKILLTGMMIVILGACTSTKNTTSQTGDTTKISRDTDNWQNHVGEIDSEYWWVQDDPDGLEDQDD